MMKRATHAHDTTHAKILVATDSATDAELVKNLLHAEFGQVFLSTEAERAVTDFDQHAPDVLILAFNELEKSERYYLGLYRQSQIVHAHPHRTIILCSKDEVKRAYEMCMQDYFDDYMLFWPMSFDTSHLLMSVHYALRELTALKSSAPSAAEFAAQARRMAETEDELARRMGQGDRHVEAASRAMARAEEGIDMALDGLSKRISPGTGETDEVRNEISRIKNEEVHRHFRNAAESVEPLKQWAGQVKQDGARHMESVRTLNDMAQSVRPTVLVVDDDELQRKIVAHLLQTENYRLIFAASGVQALGVLRKMQPDVILMDVVMPDMDGVEATRRLRQVRQFARTPVIMITGNSEKQVVQDCLKAGATGFVVKPFDRDTLVAKIAQALNSAAASPK